MMIPRLKALELHGYKTFASRIQFEFPGAITAIVGPNGSGKSNIADALRWVLGEQSYNLLRGKKTEDMIFLGSDQRPRAGMASASITFNNEDNWLPIDYTEVSVARRAYRDGGNEYLLNKQRVRLRDVTELLAQSGLAERTYTVIGQGQVDAALSLRPDERRRFFEEAAGIGLFRSRREESLSRLDNTRRNLERVQDILSELEPRLRSLERQAKRAEEYDHVKADLHVLLKDWYGYHWQNTQKDLIRNREILKNQEEKVNKARGKRSSVEQDAETTRIRVQQLREELNNLHHQSSRLHTNREKVNRDLAVLEERSRALKNQDESIHVDLSQNEEQLKIQSEKFEELIAEKHRLENELKESQEQLESSQNAFSARQAEREIVQTKLHIERKKLVEIETGQVQQKAHQRELQSRLETQGNSQKSLTESLEKAENEIENAVGDLKKKKAELLQAELKVKDIETEIKKTDEDAAVLEKEILELTRRVNQLDAETARAKTQLEIIQQAESSMTGLGEGAKNILQAIKNGRLTGRYKTISNLFDVPTGLETAIGSALGEQLDALLIEEGTDPELTLEFMDKEDSGRAVFINQKQLKSVEKLRLEKNPNVLGIASDLVRAPAELKSLVLLLFGEVLVVKDRKTANTLIQHIPPTGKIVTLKGEVFTGNGMIIAGKDKRSSIVGRPRQRKDLEQQIESISAEKENLEEQLTKKAASTKKLDGRRQNNKGEFRNAQAAFQALMAEFQTKSRQLEQHNQKKEWQVSQLSVINDQISKTGDEIKSIQEQVTNGEKRIQTITVAIRSLNNDVNAIQMDELQAQLVHWKTSSAVNERALNDVHRRAVEQESIISQYKTTILQLTERINQNALSLRGADEQKIINDNQAEDINNQIAEIQKKIDPAELELNELEKEYSRAQQDYSSAQQVETNADRVYSQTQLEYARSQESLNTLRRKIEEDFGLVALEYSGDITGPTPLPIEGINQLVSLTEIPQGLEDSINRQRALLRRMGAINPDAQKEYYEVKERHEFLSSQMGDLQKADSDLRQIIAELDEMMRRDFRTTFNAVAAEFKVMFTRLFGGGSARLVLTDDENPTETGIDIEAKLPGRREQGLSLLSGGERSLTSVALIFALLKVSPTPFCVLDEVDAMLDEANVGRFTELLKDLSQQTQFIVITHNRNTVQVADVIYGITMGRDSASQIISLKLDELTEDMVE